MTRTEALKEAKKINDNLALFWARVVRILPEAVDPIKPLDNGWDVEIEVIGENS